ncbi:uncharacterized protein [Rutidosis leptorrhynchoides]|uniref:uncharacterized protein n=1 Tax=Rutidosis leptorrhynchoides TaxID=125765 RepID=UPI003A992DEE
MASSSSIRHRLVLSLTILIGIISISATTARPCRGGAFFISTYSFSTVVNNNNPNQNPNRNSHNFLLLKPLPFGSLTIFSDFKNPNGDDTFEIFVERRLRFPHELEILRQQRLQEERHLQQALYEQRQNNPFELFSSQDFTSLRDRTKDILSVVVALLFGVGCGALAASTMYLVWTLFAHRYEYLHADQFDSDSESDEADVESPKKMGYVTIPAAESK